MTVGKAKTTLLSHTAGQVEGNAGGPSWEFIYQSSLVKAPEFNLGDRVVLPDGREFRYAKSSGICASGQSVDFDQTGAIPYTAVGAAAALGVSTVTMSASTHSAIAADALRGGYIVIWTGADHDQFRGVIGNTASAENAAITIYMDGGLSTAVTTSHYGEVYENPYASVKEASDASLGKGGVPAIYIGAANTYFWVQTRGPRFVAPQSTMTANEGVGAMFRHDGSLEAVATALGATVPDTACTQYAGFRLIGSADGNGPLFMLQG